MVGGLRSRIKRVVTRTKGPVGRQRTTGRPVAVGKVRTLIEASGVEWDVEAKEWSIHGGHEVMWMVFGVPPVVDTTEVRTEIQKNVRAIWGVEGGEEAWVEILMPRHVRINGIPDSDWNKRGFGGL